MITGHSGVAAAAKAVDRINPQAVTGALFASGVIVLLLDALGI
jgi:hypothetical protein